MSIHSKLRENWTQWARVQPEWRKPTKGKLGLAFEMLRTSLPASEYDRIVIEWKRGEREIWLDDGFVMMCLTPQQ